MVNFKVNDLVTRNSYNNDVVFKIVDINSKIATLKGIEKRLIADSPLSDLKHYYKDKNDENSYESPKVKRLERHIF